MPEDWRGFLSQLRKPTPAEDDVVRGMGAAAGGACAAEQGKVDARPAKTLATRRSVPLGEDVAVTNKVSQNLHAELLLRHLGRKVPCTGGRVIEGARLVRSFLLQAGLDADDFVFYDGSGLSGHDLLTPRATVRLLTWASTQPWFAAWKASLPVGGEDGSLVTRFGKSTLKGHLQAKTGTLSEARALSGYVEAASGRTVAFSVMVTDHAPGGHADQDVMDRMVEAIAAAN
jgi:D-alanyl-D-alanine carboxypeptidase/D-alanyl-D-alanine-endopeptidase (penicillin-binding protein 4)